MFRGVLIRLVLLILVVLTPCCTRKSNRFGYDPKWDLATDIYNNEIGKKVFVQLKKEKKLNVCESGFGLRGSDKIRCMHCGFDYFDEITIEEARELLLATSNLYLKTINENEQIRPFLMNYPFRPEDIEIRIFIVNPKDPKPNPEKLRIISIIDGVLGYMIGDRHRTTIYEESYEEALSKLGTVIVSKE